MLGRDLKNYHDFESIPVPAGKPGWINSQEDGGINHYSQIVCTALKSNTLEH